MKTETLLTQKQQLYVTIRLKKDHFLHRKDNFLGFLFVVPGGQIIISYSATSNHLLRLLYINPSSVLLAQLN